MNILMYGADALLAFLVAPPAGYGVLYLALRLGGVLRVNRDGWLAGNVVVGSRVALPAWRLFAAFQPLLRLESALRRRLARKGRRNEPAVSEVVVEVVHMA